MRSLGASLRQACRLGSVFDGSGLRLIDEPVHSALMHPNHGAPLWLILESDGLVLDRVRRVLREAGASACAVDAADVFHALRARIDFDGFIVGVSRAEDVEELKLEPGLTPLLLLAPVVEGRPSAFAVALPHARVLDRRLGDPDALRAAVGPRERDAPGDAPADAVRAVFDAFGLSERQLEVLQRALLGESAREIAARLFISELTVRNHLHAIYERVGTSGRRELQGRFLRTLLE